MQGSEAPPGVLDDVVDESFFGRERMIPAAWGGELMTPVRVYYGGAGSFSVLFGTSSAGFELWTDERGLDAIIGSLLAAKVRASA